MPLKYDSKINLIKAIRKEAGLGLKQALDIVDFFDSHFTGRMLKNISFSNKLILPDGWIRLTKPGAKRWGCSYGRCKKPALYLLTKPKGLGLVHSGYCEKCGEREMKK